jgi:uncharacterized SAM-binding protein YcdF (DUF218 family)
MQNNGTEHSARLLYNYLSLSEKPQRADLVMGFGIDDMRVPDTCSRLYFSSFVSRILFTGGVGRGSGTLIGPESLAFRDRSLLDGVPPESILTEQRSTNTLENVLFSIKLLKERKLDPGSIILVTKPHLQRRAWLTCKKHFQNAVFVNHPYPSNFDEEARWYRDQKVFFLSLAGEIKRIIEYGKTGDLEEEPLPPVVESAYMDLKDLQ